MADEVAGDWADELKGDESLEVFHCAGVERVIGLELDEDEVSQGGGAENHMAPLVNSEVLSSRSCPRRRDTHRCRNKLSTMITPMFLRIEMSILGQTGLMR